MNEEHKKYQSPVKDKNDKTLQDPHVSSSTQCGANPSTLRSSVEPKTSVLSKQKDGNVSWKDLARSTPKKEYTEKLKKNRDDKVKQNEYMLDC